MSHFAQKIIRYLKNRGEGRCPWFGISSKWRAALYAHITREISGFPQYRFAFRKERFTQTLIQDTPYIIEEITESNIDKIPFLNDAISSFWGSNEPFLLYGFGFVVFDGERLVSQILSASLCEQEAEIDIATHVHYRRRGFDGILTNRFIEKCLSIGVTPKWNCYHKNQASIKLATNAGFEIIGQYPLSAFDSGLPR